MVKLLPEHLHSKTTGIGCPPGGQVLPAWRGLTGPEAGVTEGAGERSGHQADLPEPSELYLPGSPQDRLARLLVISVTRWNTGLAFDL